MNHFITYYLCIYVRCACFSLKICKWSCTHRQWQRDKCTSERESPDSTVKFNWNRMPLVPVHSKQLWKASGRFAFHCLGRTQFCHSSWKPRASWMPAQQSSVFFGAECNLMSILNPINWRKNIATASACHVMYSHSSLFLS